MTSTAFGTLEAPAHWQAVDLISDLHLQASEPGTFEAWRAHMLSTTADAVLLLGDVFEVWVGDDAVAQDPFLQACAQVLRQASTQRFVGFMPGNRDFLVGPSFLNNCAVQALQDPTVLVWGTQRTLLSHGDALCLGDEAYQRFRVVARTPDWQAEFLAKPLTERLAMARTQAPHSATAQFFINVADNGFLNHTAPSLQGWGYAVFGKVVKGTEIVDQIRGVKTGRNGFHDDVPKEDVVIEKAVAI